MTETLPAEMSAMAIAEPGGPEALQMVTRPVPTPADGEVLIKVSHAGVNRADCLQRAGKYPPPKGVTDLPGLEVSGEVVALGKGVSTPLVGKSVCALLAGGGYAQYCVVRPEHCLPVPAGLPMAEAAALPEALFTVWHNVFQRGAARDGEVLLVHGGTSGIGSMAIALANLFGLTAIVTCGSDAKCKAALAMGAAQAINYNTQDFVEQVRAITDGRGADIVLDIVAGDYVRRNCDALATEGRSVTIALQGGAKGQLSMAQVLTKRLTLTGSTLRARSDTFKALLADEIAREAWPLAETGELRPRMDRVYSLADAAQAHARMEAGEHIGKMILQVG